MGGRNSKPLALLVDDDVELLQMAEFFLARQGFRVLTAVNGRQALDLLETSQPDVLVTDMMMPELDGLALLEEYGKHRPHAPILAVSGFLPFLEQARELGADVTLQKPYDPKVMASLALELAQGQRPRSATPRPALEKDEQSRLQALLEVRLEEWPAESAIHRFLDDVADLFEVPIAAVSAVTEDQQRLVAQCSQRGKHDDGGPRDTSFCTHAVAARAALVVQDAKSHPFFTGNPHVLERGFTFYAGVPLLTTQGEAVGTLCLLDFKPRPFTYVDLELLGVLARRVVAALEWRARRRHPDVPDSTYRHLQCVDEQLGVYGRALFSDLAIVEASRGLQQGSPVSLAVVEVPLPVLEETAAGLRELALGGIVGRLGTSRLGAVLPGQTATRARDALRQRLGNDKRLAVTEIQTYEGAPGFALFQLERELSRSQPGGPRDRRTPDVGHGKTWPSTRS
ncbi:MAG TPA: response regulator [Polyangiaceae bacterium]|nr:response regulator [Polyangiaceae bacterium]